MRIKSVTMALSASSQTLDLTYPCRHIKIWVTGSDPAYVTMDPNDTAATTANAKLLDENGMLEIELNTPIQSIYFISSGSPTGSINAVGVGY